jgi:AraC-like DNA-binding protein
MNTDHEIGKIAMNHGFPDSRAFSKAFKKRYGSLPSTYRKKIKGGSEEM